MNVTSPIHKSVQSFESQCRRLRSTSILVLLWLASLICAPAANWAWNLTPANGTFSGANWISGTIPGAGTSTPGSGDSLYFGTSTITGLTNNENAFTFGGLTFNSGASAFSLNGNALALTTGGGITNNSAATQNITNIISGAGNVVQAGTGTLALFGANTYTAGTIVSSGTLVANNASALGTVGSDTVNGTLDLNAGAVTYSGLTNGLNGNGTINVTVGTGSANSILTTAYGNYSNFTGTINIGTNGLTGASSATVPASGKSVIFASLGVATVNVLSNATLYVSGPATNAASAVLFGGTTGEAYGQLRLDGSVLWTGPITLAGNIAGGTSGTIGGNSGTPTITGNITETGGSKQFVKVGGATLVLAGTNKWTGPTIVNGGTLTLTGNQTNVTGGFYVGTNTTAQTLNIGTTTQTTPTTLLVASNATVLTASAGTAYSTINAYGASGYPTYVTNYGTMSIGRDSGFSVNNYATWVQNTNLTVQANGGYPGNFTVSAGGTYVYNGVNPANFSAPVSSGNAAITIAGTFYTAQPINFNDNGSTGYPYVNLNGGTLLLGANLNPLFVSSRTNSGPLGQVQVGTNGTLNNAGYAATITNAISNASGQNGSFMINGGGTVTLSGISTYTGGTTVNGGTLILANGGGAGAIRNNLTLNSNAIVQLNTVDSLGYSGGQNVTNVNINNSTLTNASGGNEGYAISYSLNNGVVSSSGGEYVIYAGTISSLSNSVTSYFSAPILMRGNVLTLSAAAGTVPGGVDLDVSGNLNQYDASDALIKNGTGTILFEGAGNYSGSTTINAGTLALASTASLPNTTNFAVAAGAVFDVSANLGFTLGYNQGISGSGTVNGSVADSGGSQFSPGGFNTVGTLTFNNNLTLNGGETLNFDFSTNANDVINVGGTLTPNGSTIINLANWPTGGFKQTNYVLIQAASLGGSAGSFYLQNVPTGGRQTYNIVYNTSSSPQQVLLQVSGYNANLVWQGGSGNAWDIQITQDWLNGGTADYFYTSDSVLFSNVPAANATVNITPASVAPGAVVFNSTNNYLFAGGYGYITGSASLTKNGTGSVTLTAANDYTGGTVINNGMLQLGDGISYDGSVAGNIVNNSTLVISNSSVEVFNNNINGSGRTVAGGSAALTLSGNISGSGQVVVTGDGGLTLSGTNSYTGGNIVSNGLLVAVNMTALGVPSSGVLATVGAGATLAYQVGGTQTLTNPIVGAGSLAYSNATPGSLGNGLVGLKLAVSNGFSGGLTINAGSVYAYNNHALGSGPVTIDNGNLGGGNYYNQLFVGNGLNVSNAITIVNASDYYDGVLMVDPGPNNSYGASDTNGGTFSGPITIASGATIQHGGAFCGPGNGTNYLVIAGPVTNLNSGGTVTSRNGRTRFSGGGAYDNFNIGGGLTQLGADNGLATNAALLIGGGSFDLNGYSQTLTGLSNPGGGAVNNSSTNNPSTLTLNLAAPSTYGSVISGKINLVVNGSSSLYLSGTNTYTGNTTVNGGTLEMALPTLATNSTINIASGAVLQLDFAATNTVATLVLNGVTQPAGVYDSIAGAPYITGSGALQVGSAIATNPTNIIFNVSGNTLNLSWPADHQGWLLQSNSINLAVPADWYDISNTAAGTNYSIIVDATKPNVFYRLRKP